MAAPLLVGAGFGAKALWAKILAHPFLSYFIGSEAMKYMPLPEFLTPRGERGELGLSKAQLALQAKMVSASQEAQKTMTQESRKRSDEMLAKMLGLRREERADVQQDRLMQMLFASKAQGQDTMMQLIGALMQSRQPPQLSQYSALPSMVNMLRR